MTVRLHRRILLRQLPLLLVLFVGVLWWLGNYLEGVLLSANLTSARQSSQVAVYAVKSSMRAEPSHQVWDRIAGIIPRDTGSEIEILDTDGTILFSTDQARTGVTMSLADKLCAECHTSGLTEVAAEHTLVTDPDDDRYQVFAAPLLNGEDCRICHAGAGEKLGMVLVRQSLVPVQMRVRTVLTALAIAGLVALILTVLTTRLLLGRYLGRPLGRLLAGAEAIGAGHLDHAVELPEGTELQVLAETLNASSTQLADMMGRLERQRDDSQALYRLVDQLSREVLPEERRRRAVELAGKILGAECLLVRAPDEDPSGDVAVTFPDGDRIAERTLPQGATTPGLPRFYSQAIVERWTRGEITGESDVIDGITIGYPLERSGRQLGLLLLPTPETAPDPEMVRALRRHLAIALEFSELQQELVEEERLAAIGETAAGLAHWLNGLRAGQYVIDRAVERDDPEKFRKGWAVMKKSVHRVERLTADLLYSAKTRVPERLPTDPNEVVRDVVELLEERAAGQGVRLLADLEADAETVPLERDSIHRALLNLVTNAIDACTDSEHGDLVTVRSQSAMEEIVLSVEDNGPGIPAPVQSRLFRRYFSTKGSKGTGLGLMVVKKIAEEHGGTVEVESREGTGATFLLRLPVRR